MPSFTLLQGVLLCGLLLTSTTGATAGPAETIPIPGVERLGTDERPGEPGGFIRNDGQAVLLAQDDTGRMHLLVWTKSSLRRLDLPGAVDGIWMQGIEPLSDDRLVLVGFSDDGSSHFGPAYRQLYSLRGSGKAKLRWTGNEANYALSPIQLSADARAWGVMAPIRASKEAREALGVQSKFGIVTSGLHFAFGNFRSPMARRTHTVVLYDWVDGRSMFQGDDSEFTFLDSDGPVLVASYADDVYLLRFTDSGVILEQIEPMKPLMKEIECCGRVHFVWQDEDRVLWSGGTGEWLAWNLWDLGLSGFPDEPFLRFPSAAGRPHRTRGFVRTVRDGNRYRVEHLWQSPQIPSWRERHVSEWQQATQQRTPLRQLEVSPNGRHVLAFEQRLPDEPEEDPSGQHAPEDVQSPRKSPEWAVRYYARRFELSPAPVEWPEPVELPEPIEPIP